MLVKFLPEEIQDFLTDASNFKGKCDKVYFPVSEAEVVEILKNASATNEKITIAGNRTGLTGAAVPTEGSVISLLKLNKIFEIDVVNQKVRLQPAVVLADLIESLKESGCFYPPDPTETNCFIGGTIAANASGAKTFKYGATRNFVESLRVVLSSGDIISLKRGEFIACGYELAVVTESGKTLKLTIPNYEMPKTKNASGYFCKADMDAIDLFIGSEGTLGIITEAVLNILPMPEDVLSAVAFFQTEEEGISFVEEAREKSSRAKDLPTALFSARALEYFDKNALEFLADDFSQVLRGSGSAVWFEQEITSADSDELIGEWFELIEKHGGDTDKIWTGFDDIDKKKIKEFRHAISYKVNEYISKNNFRKLGTDVAVPDNNFRELYFYGRDLVAGSGIDYVLYGHFGNSHMHLNMLPKTGEQLLQGRELYKMICKKAIDLKGTISAEHGVGKIKPAYLLEMYGGEAIQQMADLKKMLDPALILGIGNIFDEKYLHLNY